MLGGWFDLDAELLFSFAATPLLQTNLPFFLMQVKVLSWTVDFLFRDLQAAPWATFGAALEICGVSDTASVAAVEKIRILDTREIFIRRLFPAIKGLYRSFLENSL